MPDATTTDSGAPDLLASTGLNDPNSPWNLNGLLQTGLQAGVSAGQDALTAALGLQTPLASPGNGTPTNPPAPLGGGGAGAPSGLLSASKWPTYLIWGAVIALLAWVLFGEKTR